MGSFQLLKMIFHAFLRLVHQLRFGLRLYLPGWIRFKEGKGAYTRLAQEVLQDVKELLYIIDMICTGAINEFDRDTMKRAL